MVTLIEHDRKRVHTINPDHIVEMYEITNKSDGTHVKTHIRMVTHVIQVHEKINEIFNIMFHLESNVTDPRKLYAAQLHKARKEGSEEVGCEKEEG